MIETFCQGVDLKEKKNHNERYTADQLGAAGNDGFVFNAIWEANTQGPECTVDCKTLYERFSSDKECESVRACLS
jgi:hypothetical protein